MNLLSPRLIAFLISILFAASPARSGGDPRTMQPSHDAAVVELHVDGGLCTAWVVAKNRIATAAHCFGYPLQTTDMGIAAFENGRLAPVKVLKIGTSNSGNDVAIALVDTGAIEPIELERREDWRPDFCFFVGYGGAFGKNEMPCYATGLMPEGENEVMLIKGDVIPGDSGGPIFGRDHVAIALTFAYVPHGGGQGFAVPAWTVRKMLEDSAIKVSY